MRKFICIIILVSAITGIGSLAFAENGKNQERADYYEVITIKKGDSLWSIAEKYKKPGTDTKVYVEEIMLFNNNFDTKIYSGKKIILPIFE